MRIACLVMAYLAPGVLARSVPILRSAGWDVFVHLDAKADAAGYGRAMGEAKHSCQFVETPVEVFWGGYTMVQAALLLVAAARKRARYEKFVLLTDDSFPILPAAALHAHFANDADQITLRTVRDDTPTHARYRDFVCYDDVATTIRDASIAVPGSPLRVIRPDLERKVAEIAALRRRGKKRLTLYYGQAMWALTAPTLDAVTKIIDEDRHLRKSFEYSALPDETMIHSIIGNFVRPREQELTPIYVNYSGGSPVVYAEVNELPLDLQPTHGFLRKLSPTADALLDTLATRLKDGLTIHGQTPGDTASGLWIVDDGGTRRRVVRVGAPQEDGDAAGWHAIEVFWGRKFRWTAQENLEWTLPDDVMGAVRVVVSTVMPITPDLVAGCRFTLGGHTEKATILNGDLMADFDARIATHLTLSTPPPQKLSGPRGEWDTRSVGLPIAV